MAIAQSVVGRALATFETTIERGRLLFFADSIGETEAVYRDVDAAHAAGHHDLPVPPTFLFGLKLDAPDPFAWLREIGVDMRFVLHASQRFSYHRMVFAGDRVTFLPRIADLFVKRDGEFEFLTVETDVLRGDEVVAVLGETILVRNPREVQ